ncbi:MAG: flagellar biosynthesis protein FlhF [Burkholderiaceae bacterium]
MGPQRFTAKNAAEALKQVRQALGPDAMVLSTRESDEGVEILAITPDGLDEVSQTVARAGSSLQASRSTPSASLASAAEKRGIEQVTQAFPHELVISDVIKAPRKRDGSPVHTPESLAQAGNPMPASAGAAAAQKTTTSGRPLGRPATPGIDLSPSVQKLVLEMAEVKNLLQSHLATSFWSNLQQQAPVHAELVKRMINAGISPKLCADIVQSLPEQGSIDELSEMVAQTLERLIHTQDPMDIFDEGGIFTFIGPTGVGKTTTVAKIAARCVLRFGRNEVVLLTTDTYRIGAQEQLKVFAKILGLPVIAVRDSEDLTAKLSEASKKKIVLIDTAGVSQRDTLMLDQAQLLAKGQANRHRILVMSATTDLRTQEDIIQLHGHADSGHAIQSVVVTKTDEAALIGPVVDSLIRHSLPLLFISNGQRVPEDLSAPSAQYLAHRALRPRQLGADMDITTEQMPAVLADQLTQWSAKS